MGKAKKAEKCRLVLPDRSWLLIAAAACAAVGLLMKAVAVDTERGELVFGFPCFANLRAARDDSYFIRYLGGDIISIAAGALTVAAPLVKRIGLRLLAAAGLFGAAGTVWVLLSAYLGFEGNITVKVIGIFIIIIFGVLSCAPTVAIAAVLLMCDAGRLRSKKTVLLVVFIYAGIAVLTFIGNLFPGAKDYGNLSSGSIVLFELINAASMLLLGLAPIILMALSLEVGYEK